MGSQTGSEYGKAAFDAVGPLLLIGWSEKGAELHRMHHSARSCWALICEVSAMRIRSKGLWLRV